MTKSRAGPLRGGFNEAAPRRTRKEHPLQLPMPEEVGERDARGPVLPASTGARKRGVSPRKPVLSNNIERLGGICHHTAARIPSPSDDERAYGGVIATADDLQDLIEWTTCPPEVQDHDLILVMMHVSAE